MIIHALQTLLLLNKKYLSDVQIPRTCSQKRVLTKKSSERVVFSKEYDLRLPALSKIVQKHWRSMILDPWLKQVIVDPPVVAYRRRS